MRTTTNPAITAILPAFQYKRPVKYATAPRTITITFSYRIPALRILLEKIIPERAAMDAFEVEHEFPRRA